MTCTELYEWIADPSQLTKSSLQELRQVMVDYPYFHAVRLLYLKNLASLKDVRFEKDLKKMSVFIPDRSVLYHLINANPSTVDENKEQKPAPPCKNKTEIAFEVIEKAPPAVEPGEPEENDFISSYVSKPITPLNVADYSSWVAHNLEDIPTEDGTGIRLKHHELIDSFIAVESNLLGQRASPAIAKKDVNSTIDNEISKFEPNEKISLDDSYFTETLARVYIGQKRYEKALEIIKVLSLKYPKKNRYFADQIRYLEKIINIKK